MMSKNNKAKAILDDTAECFLENLCWSFYGVYLFEPDSYFLWFAANIIPNWYNWKK